MTRLDVFRRDGPAPRVDPLTGLPMPWERRPWPLAGNRLNLARDYPPAARPPAGLSFLAIDIDGMHRLNCEVGLQRADDVLVAIARAIQRIVDPAPVWRTGGDEFLTAVGGGREVAVAHRVEVPRGHPEVRDLGREVRAEVTGELVCRAPG